MVDGGTAGIGPNQGKSNQIRLNQTYASEDDDEDEDEDDSPYSWNYETNPPFPHKHYVSWKKRTQNEPKNAIGEAGITGQA